MGQRTPLYSTHVAAGARMVDFGGWDMPVNYGSQIEEHHAVRRDAGMFDVSHMCVVDLRGSRVHEFLRRLLANDVEKAMQPGKALYSCMLRENGGVIDDLIVYHMHYQWYRMVVNAGTRDKDLEWLRAQAGPFGVAVEPCTDLAMIAVQGPNARDKVWRAIPESAAATSALKPFNAVTVATSFGELFIARTGYTGEDGFEIVVPSQQAEAVWRALEAQGIAPCGLGARDTLRLEAGMNLYGQDMDRSVNPLESGLAWTVDLAAERDFVGKAALVAAKPERQLVGVVLQDAGGVLRAHQRIHTGQGEGEMTSGTFSPTMKRSIGLARVPIGVRIGDVVHVEVRDRRLAARVVKRPFVRQGKVLVD